MEDIKLFSQNLIILYKIIGVLPLKKVSKFSFAAVLLSCTIVFGTFVGFLAVFSMLQTYVYTSFETVSVFIGYVHSGMLTINLFVVMFIILFKHVKYLPVIQNNIKQHDLLKPPNKQLKRRVQFLSNVLLALLLLIIITAVSVIIYDYIISTIVQHEFTGVYISFVTLTYFENIVICVIESQFIFICCQIRIRFEHLNDELLNIIDIFDSDKLFQSKVNTLKKTDFINSNLYKRNHKMNRRSGRNLLHNKTENLCTKVKNTLFREISSLPAVEEVEANLFITVETKILCNGSYKMFTDIGHNCSITTQYITDLHICHRVLCLALSSLHKLYRTQMFLTITVSFLLFIISVYNVVYRLLVTSSMSSCYMGPIYWMTVTLTRFATNVKISEGTVTEMYKTKSLLTHVTSKNLDPKVKDELKRFTDHVTRQSPLFSPLGFFKVKSELLTSALDAVATYVIILLQYPVTK